jgi:hypothetical protein
MVGGADSIDDMALLRHGGMGRGLQPCVRSFGAGFVLAGVRLRSRPPTGRLVVRRTPDLNPKADHGQATLFDTWRFHAFFTTTDPEATDTVAADKTHRRHAIIEQVNADLKNSALAHLPSGKFDANAARLVLAVMAFNLTRTAATITGPALPKPPPRPSAAN